MNNTYIKSPLNYMGGKHKLLPQIIPLFPKKINIFIDLFGGGFNVGINVDADMIVYNDINNHLLDIFNLMKETNSLTFANKIEDIMIQYGLNKTVVNDEYILKNNYLKLRSDYNEKKDIYLLYSLICCSFSNQIRFNSKDEFNLPYGSRYFNPSMRNNLINFVDAIHNKHNLKMYNLSYLDLLNTIGELGENDLVYCDPPYYNSNATYNEKGGWTYDDERNLLSMLDSLSYNGVKFALSNNLKYNNELLYKWKDNYNTYYLNGSQYNNCNYHKKDRSKDIEVLITNY